ncbi:hypothetical protein OG453_43485 [Streptomyces sp. NBC_01381]|uniref:hypothetical protein n=1 Tax=Streptomyces sp. NBC_01381 TaxID=2903845 RepID=UPI0022512134|nr:hypothetical protein [Streptomyces sp. NBC_01381]MCX4673426.1 hypothetical protein [Streptomyces sp. NBC_01381]
MDPLVLAAATALVGAMATDAWLHAKTAAVTWWRSVRPEQEAEVHHELEEAHSLLLTTRERGNEDVEQALVGAWCVRLHQLLSDSPEVMTGLRELLDDHLRPAAASHERPETAPVTVQAEARDSARIYVAGRDQHITGH